VKASEPCLVFTLDRETFERLLNEGDLVAYKMALKMARNLADRLAWVNDKVFGLLSHDCDTKSHEFDAFRDEILERLGLPPDTPQLVRGFARPTAWTPPISPPDSYLRSCCAATS
jgi:hypothetical protein